MNKLFILFLLMVSCTASADIVLSVGVGKGITREAGTPFERAVALGYEHRFKQGFFVRPEVGYFMDNSGQGLSSFWAGPLIGVAAVSTVGPTLHLAIGPSYLHHPDQILGGHFQFSLEGGISLLDDNFSIGLYWKHLSSAGFEMPNKGRDFIVAQVRILAL
jgi:hypothetical protein